MIVITQTCDGCGEIRYLKVGYRNGAKSIEAAAESGGWRQLKEFKHLCAACISKAVDK